MSNRSDILCVSIQGMTVEAMGQNVMQLEPLCLKVNQETLTADQLNQLNHFMELFASMNLATAGFNLPMEEFRRLQDLISAFRGMNGTSSRG